MVDCLSWHSFYGSLRSSKSYVKGNRILSKPTIGKSNLSFTNHDTQLDKKQCNSNNNNNNGTLQSADESNVFLEFFIFNISRERSIHLCKNTNDKRLLSFYNISNGLYKNGVRNGDILIFLNGTNIIKPPIALTIDRVKSEFTALRRQNKPIQIGICRCVDRSIFNNATVQHLGSLTIHEFENLSRHEESNEIHKSTTIVHSESKKLLSLFSNKKKLISNGKRKSILDKTNEIDQRNLSSNSMKHENEILTVKTNEDKNSFITQQSTKKTIEHVDTHTDKESKESTSNRNLSTQIFTDACFIYRRQVIKHPQDTNAMILRGREIAHEAANSPTIPSSMPNYSHDQIRELYGEIDKKTRRLKENQYIFHTPMIDAWNETPPWSVSSTSSLIPNQCPLPKFRLDKNDETIFMATYFSTGLSNRRTLSTTDDKDIIRGSFRTSVGERTSVSPSPLLLNVRFDYKKLNSPEMIAKDESNVIPDYIQSYSTEQSTEPLNHINSSSSSKLDPLATKNVETMDIDSLIDLDDQTAISYHTDKESQMDLELDSLFSRKNQPTTCVHSQSIDVTPRMKPNDLFKTITSPDDSCYYDALTSSIQSSIFSDNFFEQVETLNHINKIEKLSSKQIDGDVSIDNLSEIIREINQTPSCINHLVFAYDHQSIQPQGADAVSNDQMEITNTKTLSQQSSIEPEIPSTNTNIYQESLSSDDENNYRQITSDIDEDFEELYQRYLTNLNQYQKILEQIDQVEQKLSPIDEEINSMNEHVSKNQTQLNSSNVILSVKRQSNHIGHYGFELEQTFEGKIKISSIIDSTYCPNLNVGDEILGINNIATLTILEQYYLLFNTLWHNQYEYIDLTIKKTVSSSTLPHSNILSWSIPKVESGKNHCGFCFFHDGDSIDYRQP
ncbi:hypothetical protein I4U23_025838 [Adineta vaga]|nr:hypothetical protein I4U23_025838 [Adineta vaga]